VAERILSGAFGPVFLNESITHQSIGLGVFIDEQSPNVTLTPGIVTDSDAIFAPTATPGAATLTPILFSDTDTFFAPTASSTYTLLPGLFTDTDTFFAPTVAAGAVTLTPGLIGSDDAFYAPAASLVASLLPGLLDDSVNDSVYNPAVSSTYTLTPGLVSDSDAFYAPSVEFSPLLPGLVTDADSFFAPAATSNVTIAPSLFSSGDVIFVASLLGMQLLAPALALDADSIYSPGASSDLLTGLVVDDDSFFAPAVTLPPQFLVASLLTDADVIFTGTYLGPNGGKIKIKLQANTDNVAQSLKATLDGQATLAAIFG
jgi:hypothetical protein